MKKNISRIWGVGLVLVVLGSLLFSALPVSAGTNSWGTVTMPSETSKVITPGIYNQDLAVAGNGSTLYAALYDDANDVGLVYKSTDTGKKWSNVSDSDWLSTNVYTDRIAVSPDDPNIVAFIDQDNTEVWLTTNGGTSWTDLGQPTAGDGSSDPASNILGIAISGKVSGTSYIGVVGDEAGPRSALWYFNSGAAVTKWRIATDAAGLDGWDATGFTADDYAVAIAFSPNFPSDRIATIVTFTDSGDVLFQVGSFAGKSWNTDVGGFDSYPVLIDEDAGTTGTRVYNADIALGADYLGADSSTRIAFVGTSTTGTTDEPGGIYALDDNDVTDVKTGAPIRSVAYNTSANKLLAGADYDWVGAGAVTNAVYRSSNPTASDPDVSSAATYKKPGVNANNSSVVVAWSGNTAISGSGGAGYYNSAQEYNYGSFAISRDDGKSWNDISLINFGYDWVSDMAVSADGAKQLFNASDGTAMMVFRYDGAWEGVFDSPDLSANDILLRTAPEDFAKFYVVEQGSDALFYTSDAGETKWTIRYATADMQDLAVESASVIYAAQLGSTNVIKSSNGGFLWDDAVDTGSSGNIWMLKSLSKDNLILGTQDGYVDYSKDGGANWTELDDEVANGNVVVTASGLNSGDFVYAATDVADDNVYHWQIGTNTSWDDIFGTVDVVFPDGTMGVGYGVYGITLAKGALYVVANDGTDSFVARTLSPSTADSSTGWDSKAKTGVVLGTYPGNTTPLQGLYTSTGSVKLWALDGNGTDYTFIYSLTDDIVDTAPALAGPADAVVVKVNPITGRAQDVNFTWNRDSNAISYQLRVALDKDFTQVISTTTVASTDAIIASIGGPFITDSIEWQDGWTYYWKVRVLKVSGQEDDNWHSGWSTARSFSVAVATVTPPVTITPAPPAPVINLPAPVINLPAPTTITIPPAQIITIPPAPAPPAPIAPAYIWAVVIIGAVLVIAVIILIVRTRRPV